MLQKVGQIRFIHIRLSEWKTAWEREHSMDDRFPSGVFAPYTDAQ